MDTIYNYGDTDLHKAVISGSIENVKLLLNDNPIKIDAVNYFNNTSLHIACAKEYYDIAKLLLDKGANMYISNLSKFNPLMISINNDSHDIFNLLIDKGYDVNYQNQDGDTALHIALKSNNIYYIKTLIDKKASPYILNNKLECPLTYNYKLIKETI